MGSRADLTINDDRFPEAARRSVFFYIVIAVGIGIAGFAIGILIGRFAACDALGGNSRHGLFNRIIQDADPGVSELLINDVSNVNIENNLR